jgi:hypothetical protein
MLMRVVGDKMGFMDTRNATTTGKLTAKQQRFVEEYLIDPNATQAAMRAGYSPGTARVIASQNLTKPNIHNAIRRAQATTQERLEVTRDTVVRGLYAEATAPDANRGHRIQAWGWLAKILGLVVDRSRVEALVEHQHTLKGLSKADLMVLVEEGRAAKAEREGRMLEGEAREV